MALLTKRGADVQLPAFCTAHSHVFQRAMRGQAQRPGPADAEDADDFWSWRTAMYQLALTITPERLYKIARIAYRELRAAGVLTVGEFHYLHHQPDGTPYDDRTLLADVILAAAKAEGLRIALLRGIYARAGANRPAEGAQKRFCDPTVEAALADVATLRSRYHNDSSIRIGVAPHSVRALPTSWIRPLAHYAEQHHLPLHMHVAEQPAEVDACLAETGLRPVELLADRDALSARFVAVHATHLAAHEARLLGEAHTFVCLTPTTERDLGDGLPDVSALRAAGVRLCTGIDSYVLTDPFEEMRGVELGERLRTLRRITQRAAQSPAEQLWSMASHEGARALGFADAGGVVVIDANAPPLALVDDEYLLDALVFSAGPSVVKSVHLF